MSELPRLRVPHPRSLVTTRWSEETIEALREVDPKPGDGIERDARRTSGRGGAVDLGEVGEEDGRVG